MNQWPSTCLESPANPTIWSPAPWNFAPAAESQVVQRLGDVELRRFPAQLEVTAVFDAGIALFLVLSQAMKNMKKMEIKGKIRKIRNKNE